MVRPGGDRVAFGKVGHLHLGRSAEERAGCGQENGEYQEGDSGELIDADSHNGVFPEPGFPQPTLADDRRRPS